MKITLKDCNGVYTITDDTGDGYLKRYTVTDYNNVVIIPTTSIIGLEATMTLPNDGLYIITFESMVSIDVWEVTLVSPIYQYCTFKACIMALIKDVLCNEYDPCCKTCSQEDILKMQNQRYTINQLHLLYMNLLAYIHRDTVEYLGVVSIDTDRLSGLSLVDNLFDKIEKILERCELCLGALQTTTDSTTPCNCH